MPSLRIGRPLSAATNRETQQGENSVCKLMITPSHDCAFRHRLPQAHSEFQVLNPKQDLLPRQKQQGPTAPSGIGQRIFPLRLARVIQSILDPNLNGVRN